MGYGLIDIATQTRQQGLQGMQGMQQSLSNSENLQTSNSNLSRKWQPIR
ncbi:hypothetical protein ACIPU9_04850 [Pectobacterium jejuense]|uniref:Uncharacterized protein n=1 Tax=Pectobacterium jejuense TaxID=2974022 RepID=A0ABW8GSQ4_9GAMM